MAILKNGISGPIEGSVGSLIFYTLNGQTIVRSRRRKSTTPASLKQLAVRQKAAIVGLVLKQFNEFVKVGYANAVTDPMISAYNLAASEALCHAVKGAYPEYELDYASLALSSGSLLPAASPVAHYAGTEMIFNWQPEQDWPDSNDRVMMLAYCPELNEAIYNLVGAKRSAGTDSLTIDVSWAGKAVETYISFRSESNQHTSKSCYTGRIICTQTLQSR